MKWETGLQRLHAPPFPSNIPVAAQLVAREVVGEGPAAGGGDGMRLDRRAALGGIGIAADRRVGGLRAVPKGKITPVA